MVSPFKNVPHQVAHGTAEIMFCWLSLSLDGATDGATAFSIASDRKTLKKRVTVNRDKVLNVTTC